MVQGKEDRAKNNKGNNKTDPEKSQESTTTDFPIVGIGASAGGLAAFKEFFSGMPGHTEPGMAFVLVQHLAPDHKSALTDIIRHYTSMQVLEVEDGMQVQPNCAYIIPPNHDMTFGDGALHLKEPSASRGHRMPIDIFFRSLARDQGRRAICVILSGTGSDGTLGLRAIKGEGGMAMVQKPESASYDGMPRNALATGLVDYQLPPADMPGKLMAYVDYAFGSDVGQVAEPSGQDKMLKKVFIRLRNQTGYDFSRYKESTINRRIEHRMSVQQIKSLERYVKYLEQSPGEVEKLFRDLLIGVTSFFRDPEAFDVLKREVIPSLFTNRRETGLLRLWVPGCATGEEAYSLAILIAEYQEKMNHNFKVQIFATDIDSRAIASARRGLFPATIAADITPDRLSRFFETDNKAETYRIQKRIREMLIFSEQNIIEDPPFSRLDLISCRNLLIYMKRDLQKKILSLFRYALNPDGFLILGTSETLGASAEYFSAVDSKWKIYQLKEEIQSAHRAAGGNFLPQMTKRGEKRLPLPEAQEDDGNYTLRELTEQKVLEQFTPPAVLVNNRGQVLYIHGHTGLYLEPAPGRASVNNILKMAREGLQGQLATALHRSSTEGEQVFCPNLSLKTNNDKIEVNLTVSPVKNESHPQLDSTLYLVVLEQVSAPAIKSSEPVSDPSAGEQEDISDSECRQLVADLRQQLQAKEESLQNTVEELQTANEELKSSNEELQSVNEELQSTNEELETSKEELQSLNEELTTVNAELETKVAELTQANADMNNLLSGTGIGTVFVDLDLNILRFTPSATEFINLIDSDIGRPVGHIASNLVDYDNLSEDTQGVLDTLVPREIEVQTQDGKWYMMRIQPYRTEENVIKGAVITFRDINERKKLQEELWEVSRMIARQMAETVFEPLVVLDTELRVVSLNNAFCDIFKVSPGDYREQKFLKVDNGRWDIPDLCRLLTDLLDQTAIVHDYRFTHDFPETGKQTLRINARRVSSETDSFDLILLAIKKIKKNDHNPDPAADK